jgi:hypothetical protein
MAKKAANKSKRGGAREGAGRPLDNPDEGRKVLVAATVPQGLLDELDALRVSKGWNRSQAVTEAIRGLLAKSKKRRAASRKNAGGTP